MPGLNGETVNVRAYFSGTTRINAQSMGEGITNTDIFVGSVVVGSGIEVPATHFSYRPSGGGNGQLTAEGDITVDLNDTGYVVTFSGTAQPYGIYFVFTSLTGESIGTITAASQTASSGIQSGVNGTNQPQVDANYAVTSGFDLYGYQPGTNVSQTVSLTFGTAAPGNSAPVADNDSRSVSEDGTLNASSVLANDTDADGNSLTATLVTTVAHGTLSFNANGTFSYTPVANFNGADSFTYKANDGTADSNVATVSISVAAVNDAPVVTVAALGTAIEQTTVDLAGKLSATDVDAGSGTVTATVSVNYGVLAFAGAAGVAASGTGTGAVTLNGTLASINAALATANTLTYNANTNTPPPSATLTFNLSDNRNTGSGSVLADQKTGTISITPVNDAPTTANATVTGSEDDVVTFRAADFPFTDPDDSLNGIVIKSLPTVGTLSYGGVAATANTLVSANDLALGRLTYQGAADGSGSPYASFTFAVRDLGGGTGVPADSANSTLTINLTPDATLYTIANVSANEGDATGGTLTFTVVRNGPTTTSDTLYLSYADGSANLTSDYLAGPATVVIAAGSDRQTFTVPIVGDYDIEADQTVAVSVYRDTGRTNLVAGATGTIVNDDIAGSLSISDVSIIEGNAGTQNAAVTVTRSGGFGNVSVGYSTVDGGGALASATAGSDYIATFGVLNFDNGSASQTILIPVRGDTVLEPNEQFSVLLSNAGIPALRQATIADGLGLVTIVNDDGGPGTTPGTGSNGGSNVTTPSSFVASPDARVTSIQTSNPNGADPINLTGNFGDQQITGNNGDNIINGGGGNDTLVGLGGNDTYLVRGPGDVVIEANGGGRDTVFTTVSYNLGVNEIEVLSTVDNSATDNINLIGNFASQTIIGNYGSNILNGGSGGLDTLIGLRGDDLYAVGDSRTVIVENAGEGADTVVSAVDYTLGAGVSVEVLAAQNRGGTEALSLRGNELAQTVVGNDGANIIDGGAGSDVLVGGGGADRFAFTTALGNGNVDAIVDFAAGTDRIQLSSAIFGAVGTSVTAAGFVTGSAATTVDQHIVYNATTGQIFYDADGSGAGAAILFATVAAGTQLSAASFEVAAPVVIG